MEVLSVLRKIDIQILKIMGSIPVEKSNPYYIAGVLGKSFNSIYQSFKVITEMDFIQKVNIDNKTCFELTEEGKKYVEDLNKPTKSDIDFIMEK